MGCEMGIASFEKGAVVLINECPHVLKRSFDDNVWQVEEEKTGRIKEFKLGQLRNLYKKGELLFAGDSKTDPLASDHNKKRKRTAVFTLVASDHEWERAKAIRQYVMAVMDCPSSRKMMEPEIQKVWKKLGAKKKAPNWVTVSRWKNKYLSAGKDINVFITQNHQKGNRVRRYSKEILNLVEKAVDNVFMTRERNTYEDTLNNAIKLVEHENKLRPDEMQLPLPTSRLVKRAVDSIPMFDRHAARYGRMAAIRMFRAVLKKHVCIRVLESAEIDHTKLDLFVVDDETGMPWGRPWVTICIDSYSRCILGIYVGFEPPSYLSVARCLKQAFLPKDDLQDVFPEINNSWEAHGVMEKLVVDNGLEFHSNSLETICFSLGIDLQYTPRKTPWWKGKIERFIGTMNRGIAHGNPGTTFANIVEKDDYNPVEHAVITFKTLKLVMNKWIADVYHQRPHSSLDNVSPAVMWASSIRAEEIKVPEDPAKLDALMGKVDHRTLTHKGIEFEGLRYNSTELVALRRRLGDKLDVELRVDEGNLGHIYVISPDMSEYFQVSCLNQEYASGLTLWQHNVCKRYAANHLKEFDGHNAWRRAKEEISEIILRDILKKRKKSSSKVARFKLVGQPQSHPVEPEAVSTTSEAVNVFPPSIEACAPIVSVAAVSGARPRFTPLIEDRLPADQQ